MKKLLLIGLLFASLAAVGQETKKEYDTETYRKRMALFAKNPLTKGQIVFLGNSITQGGKWSDYFPNQNVANRGISGDNTEGMLNRIAEIAQSQPEKLFIMAGVNDISQNVSNDQIIAQLGEIIKAVKEKSPHTAIYVQSAMPINNDFAKYKRLINKEKQIEKLNKKLEKFCKSRGDITFVNTYASFLIQKRKMDPKYTGDGLHLNADGYKVWIGHLRPLVEK